MKKIDTIQNIILFLLLVGLAMMGVTYLTRECKVSHIEMVRRPEYRERICQFGEDCKYVVFPAGEYPVKVCDQWK